MTRPVRRVAVVTGGAGAIGGSVAATLTAADHQVVIMDRTGDVPVDLGDEGQVRAAAQRVLDQSGRCDVLVHAAAAFDRADLARLDLAVWRRALAVAHGPDGIAVTCVAPGLTATPAARAGMPAAAFEAVRAPPGAAPRPGAWRRGGYRRVPRLRRRGRAHRPGAVHRRRPGHALTARGPCHGTPRTMPARLSQPFAGKPLSPFIT
jgi:NAD(P)-dependent dehydrogenase (short-subunit alcohol dehydrogenase family)